MNAVKIKHREPRRVDPSASPIKLIPKNEFSDSCCLCQGRHDIIDSEGRIIEEAIFENTLPIKDIEYIQAVADEYFIETVRVYKNMITNNKTLHMYIYVTGLSAALIAVISSYTRIAKPLGVKMTFMHYDKDKANYFPQEFDSMIKGGMML